MVSTARAIVGIVYSEPGQWLVWDYACSVLKPFMQIYWDIYIWEAHSDVKMLVAEKCFCTWYAFAYVEVYHKQNMHVLMYTICKSQIWCMTHTSISAATTSSHITTSTFSLRHQKMPWAANLERCYLLCQLLERKNVIDCQSPVVQEQIKTTIDNFHYFSQEWFLLLAQTPCISLFNCNTSLLAVTNIGNYYSHNFRQAVIKCPMHCIKLFSFWNCSPWRKRTWLS